MKLSDFHILYINLDRRPERKNSIENELLRLNLLNNATRISAIDGQLIDQNVNKLAKEFNTIPEKMNSNFWLNRSNFKTMCKISSRVLGRVGCYLSHLRAFNYAKKHNLFPLLIIEDDCIFNIDSDIEISLPPKTCDMFYLGALFWHLTDNPAYLDNSEWCILDSSKLKLICTFSYGLMNRNNLDNMIKLMTSVWNDGKSCDKPRNWKSGEQKVRATSLDLMYVNFVQKYGNVYFINPQLTKQSNKFISDITDLGKKTPSKPYKHNYYY